MYWQDFDWSKTDKWPFDGPDYVFLGRAVGRLGAAMFPEWVGDEAYAKFLGLPLPKEPLVGNVNRAVLFTARKLLKKYRPELALPDVNLATGEGSDKFTQEMWDEARKAEKQQIAVTTAKQKRFDGVKLAIREHCAHGRLTAAVRYSDGSFMPVNAHIWNTERYGKWFASCQISSADAFSSSMHGASSNFYWLFVDEKALSKIAARPAVPAAAKDAGYVSPYMQLMFDVVREFGITPEHQSKIDLIRDYIEREWKIRGFPESKKLQEAMGTMVRDPRAQSGGLNRTRPRAVKA